MMFQDNIIKEFLKNVYFVTGTPTGGKSTISKALGAKYDIPVYNIDEQFDYHLKFTDERYQPNMNRKFKDADEFFGRSVEEYKSWLIENTREQLDIIVLDLIRLSRDRRIICDCHLTFDEIENLTDPSRVALLITDPTDLVEKYSERPDHQGFRDFINSASDVKKAKETCTKTLYSLNVERYNAIKASNYFWLEKDITRSVDDTAELVAKHFGFSVLPDLTIEKVEKGSALADELLSFVENCSWIETREHIAGMVKDWVFDDWETMFAAKADGKIIGMTSVMKEDYYPLPEICPWVSCVFVTEEYRGARVSEKLIAYANDYLKGLGFTKSYIPSMSVGLYEHYGYHYVRDIVNYGGGTDYLFVKEL